VPLSHEAIAAAFSRHDFDAAFPFLADDVSWEIVGIEPLIGKDAVMEACSQLAVELVDVTTEFRRFRTVSTDSTVVIDSLADYTDAAGEVSTVASCDLYDFEDNRVTTIASYNIEML
jgi:limonene-1,2-epoxide hydrolase